MKQGKGSHYHMTMEPCHLQVLGNQHGGSLCQPSPFLKVRYRREIRREQVEVTQRGLDQQNKGEWGIVPGCRKSIREVSTMYRDFFFTCSKIMRTISTVGILVFDDRYRKSISIQYMNEFVSFSFPWMCQGRASLVQFSLLISEMSHIVIGTYQWQGNRTCIDID